jgi:twitching motility protein PilT
MMDINEILKKAVELGASDIFIVAGLPLTFKINGSIVHEEAVMMTPSDTESLIQSIYDLANHRGIDRLLNTGDDDFSFAVPRVSRFRVNTYRQRGSLASVIRVITFDIPDHKSLHIPRYRHPHGRLQERSCPGDGSCRLG